ncbi:MAG: hypothetical protein AB1898_28255 [Acidobacteriota bacterium]
MADRGDGVLSELSDFLTEIACPSCQSKMKVAPIWSMVLEKGYSTCGNCWQIFALRSGAKMEGNQVRPEDLETVVDDFESSNAGEYLWSPQKLENTRNAAVDFFFSVALTAFFDGMEKSYPRLQTQDYGLAWRYLSQAAAFAVSDLDTRLIADAFEKLENYKPYDWNG